MKLRVLGLCLGMMLVSAAAAAQEYWGAVAAGIDVEREFVGVGVSSKYPTEAEAIERALAECRVTTPYDCEIVFTFNDNGCAFISYGDSDTELGYGTGPDAQSAYNQCESQGLDCGAAIGACN